MDASLGLEPRNSQNQNLVQYQLCYEAIISCGAWIRTKISRLIDEFRIIIAVTSLIIRLLSFRALTIKLRHSLAGRARLELAKDIPAHTRLTAEALTIRVTYQHKLSKNFWRPRRESNSLPFG